MDLISLHYFQELSKDLNMTKTAERLYISQQTLSNHIQRLEQYYNAPLFYRKPSLSLTCAGEFVLGFAQVMGEGGTQPEGHPLRHRAPGAWHPAGGGKHGKEYSAPASDPSGFSQKISPGICLL